MPSHGMQSDARGYDWPPPPRGRDLRAGWEPGWHGGRLPPPPQRHLTGRDSQDSPPHMRGPSSSIREVHAWTRASSLETGGSMLGPYCHLTSLYSILCIV